jgi:hypothetical protein
MWLLNRSTTSFHIGGTAWRTIGWSLVAISVALDLYSVVSFLKVRGGPAFLDGFRGRDKCNSIGYAAAASG